MKWYHMHIDELTPEQYGEACLRLAPEQRVRLEAFRQEDDRKRLAAGELLARKAIGVHTGLPEEKILLGRLASGKPFAYGVAVEFSVSHSGGLVVCAVDDRPVGIDVERLGPVNLKIARKLCSPEELRYIFGTDPAEGDFAQTEEPERIRRFFRIWTGKEACAKRAGQGLGALSRFHPLEEEKLRYEICGDHLICIAWK